MEAFFRNLLRDVEARILTRVSTLIEQRLATLMLLTNLVNTSEGDGQNPFTDQASGWATGGEEKPGTPAGTRVELPGLCVVPLPKEPALMLNHGPQPYLIPLASERFRPKTARRGDVILYCLSQRQGLIKILATDGSITLETGKARVRLGQDGRTEFWTDGGGAALEGARLTVNKEVALERLFAGGGKPVATGTNVNVALFTVLEGTDAIFKLSIKVVNNPATDLLGVVAYTRKWPAVPQAVLIQNGTAEKIKLTPTDNNVNLNATSLPVGEYEMTVITVGGV